MKFENKLIGKIGEEAAVKYLSNLGYSIQLTNFQTRFGEVDIIAQDKERLVFVEVKAKKTLVFGTPEEMFTRGKYNKVKRMATVYLNGQEVPCRIDMVAVELNLDNSVKELRHHKNITY